MRTEPAVALLLALAPILAGCATTTPKAGIPRETAPPQRMAEVYHATGVTARLPQGETPLHLGPPIVTSRGAWVLAGDLDEDLIVGWKSSTDPEAPLSYELHVWPLHRAPVAYALSPEEEALFVLATDRKGSSIARIDLHKGEAVERELQGRAIRNGTIVSSPDGSLLLSDATSASIRRVEATTFFAPDAEGPYDVERFRLTHGPAWKARLASNGERVIVLYLSGQFTGRLGYYATDSGELLDVFPYRSTLRDLLPLQSVDAGSGALEFVLVLTGNNELLTIEIDGAADQLDSRGTTLTQNVPWRIRAAEKVLLKAAADGKVVLVAEPNATRATDLELVLQTLVQPQVAAQWEINFGFPVDGLAVSPDGSFVAATNSTSGELKVFRRMPER